MRHPILILFLLWNSTLSAQLNGQYAFKHIDASDGLLYPSLRGIGQDARGFIWILTLNGLQRYDGSRFVNYPQVIGQSSLGVMHNSELYVDTVDQQIWVIKGKNIVALDLNNNKLQTIHFTDLIKKNTAGGAFYFDATNSPYWIDEHGIILYDRDTSKVNGHFINFHPDQQGIGKYLIHDPVTGNFWMSHFYVLSLADVKTKRIHSSDESNPPDDLLLQLHQLFGKEGRFRYIMLDSKRNMWISTWTPFFYKYNLDTHVLKTYSLKNIKEKEKGMASGDLTLQINALYEDRQKNIWMATDYAGLLRYNERADDFDFITSDERIANGLKYNYSIYSIFQDREDNIWLGTDWGISLFNPYKNYVQTIRHIDGEEQSIPQKDINDVVETSTGEILIATWGGGISIYDHELKFIRNVTLNGPNACNLVWCFVKRDDGIIWAGAQDGYIHEYDPMRQTFHTIQPAETGHSTILCMQKDDQGNILIGLNNGQITFWKKTENKFYAFNTLPSDNSLMLASVNDIFVDASGHDWVTSASGLYEFDPLNHRYIHHYLPDTINEDKGMNLQGIDALNDSVLMIGTVYKGVYGFNLRTHSFSNLFTDLIPNKTSVFAIKKDHSGNIWFSTNSGLMKINNSLSQVTQFDVDRLAMHAAFGSNRFYEMKDNRWLTTTPAELICFDPQQLALETSDHDLIQIGGFKVFQKDIYIDSFIQQQKPLIFPYDQNFFSIEFTSFHFLDWRHTQYYYRLTTINEDWIKADDKLQADYTDLHPGKYVFEVKAEQGNGFSGITSFALVILPPWWKTWWFRIASLLIIISTVYWVIRKRIDVIRQQSELKQRIAETEMMALRAQMNPHFIFNCLNSIDNLIQTDQKEKATDYLAKFAQLIRAILENSKSNVILCWKDLEALNLYLDMESLRWDDKIKCQFDIDPQILNGDFKVPPMVIQPFVENAIHHGLLNKLEADKKLNISVWLEEPCIRYSIRDNGVGRQQAAAYKKMNMLSKQSYGIQMTQERIRLFNQEHGHEIKITDLFDDQQKANGTLVDIWLTTQPMSS
ncbi:MAG: histidine kinase [Bacteroidota bacterium]|nr:histidine kinase [Bacteroidota bacterium]